MRLIFAGTPSAALPALESLIHSEHEILAVLTRPDSAQGRGKEVLPSVVGQYATEMGLRVIKAQRASDVADELLELQPDLAVVVAYGALIKDPLLTAWPWVNLHFSLLPAYRGAAPVQHALLAGEEITGVTTFLLNEGMDTGPILGQATTAIQAGENAGELLHRLSHVGADLLSATLADWESLTLVPQSNDGASSAPKITTEMARIDWGKSAALIERHIRAMAPEPSAWTMLEDIRVQILSAEVVGDSHQPGRVVLERNRIVVGTGSGALVLREVKAQGKRAMSASDWARGLHRSEIDFS